MPTELLIPPGQHIVIPDGPPGTRIVLREMMRLARFGKRQTASRILVQAIIAHVPNKAWMTEIRAIFNWVRANIRYMLDTNGMELLQSPEVTLQMASGDCDDFCILLATLLECAGHPCRFVALGFPNDQGDFSHVVLQTRGAGEGRWITLDATEDQPMGWFPPDVTNQMIQDV